MDRQSEDNTDGSSIKPVSSLRSHFENITTSKPKPKPKPPALTPLRPASPAAWSQRGSPERNAGRRDGQSLDIPRAAFNNGDGAGVASRGRSPHAPSPEPASLLRPAAPGTPRQRPISMGPMSPHFPLPAVTVEAPVTALQTAHKGPPDHATAVPSDQVRSGPNQRGAVPLAHESGRAFKIPARPAEVVPDPRKSPFLGPSEAAELPPLKSPSSLVPSGRTLPGKASPRPPPINRADKPKPPAAPPAIGLDREPGPLSMLAPAPSPLEDQVSPFSTPPGSDDETSPELPPHGTRPTRRAHVAQPSTEQRQSYFAAPPVHHAVADKRRDQNHPRTISHPPPQNLATKPRYNPPPPILASRGSPERRPGLPPRRETVAGDDRARTSGTYTSAATLPPSRIRGGPSPAKAPSIQPTTHFPPPPKRQMPLSQEPEPMPEPDFREETRAAATAMTSRLVTTPSRTASGHSIASSAAVNDAVQTTTEYPDTSQVNRRKPYFKKGPREINTKSDTRLLCVGGEYVCSTGHLTRAWSVHTGEQVMSLSHGETTRVLSIAFKPTAKVDDQGTQLWLGTNMGEILEVDIPTASVLYTKSSAHPRREIIKIYRHGKEMWTLDDEGKLHLWPADESGAPDLKNSYHSFRLPRGHTFSLVTKNHLWVAAGKDIRVFEPSADANTQFQVLARPLNQPGVGDVTSGTTIGTDCELVLFGHMDGKVTIYSQGDYACLGIVNVSVYKITALAGVGDYLWAGFNTGMIYVYDTNTTPWRVQKDWHAHQDPIVSIIADPSSFWQLDCLQVASLGADNHIRLWDGMLQEDWLEHEMQRHDPDFCQFREIKALIMTWNAGASTPGSLKRDDRDSDRFRELINSVDSPDILVFGFQELVDLEDKKMTAKSFFKSSKKKDAYDQEHMSHQYRDWRDYLTRVLDETMSTDETYTLLHTSNMVGLFTCIFVKTAERLNIRNLHTVEVKCGMGGLHGNKGALVVRFCLDDSSLCFVNCHLAAGQTQTTNRNNDVATILEATTLPMERDPTVCMDTYIGGGDGSMILDHEICILNGDLNYRIDTMGRDTVVNAVKADNLGKLLERDQLLVSRRKNPTFRLRAFKESPVAFAPTYKYDVGTDRYDTSEKKRSPAWCDRVLYRGLGRIKPLEYRRHEVRVSDHRPVTAAFKIRVKMISPNKRVAVWEQSQAKLLELQRRMADAAKLDFLVNVCELEKQPAKSLLRSRNRDAGGAADLQGRRHLPGGHSRARPSVDVRDAD